MSEPEEGSSEGASEGKASGDGGGGPSIGTILKVVAGVVLAGYFIATRFFGGSDAYDKSFALVTQGMARAQVVEVMGKPDIERPGDEGKELLVFEAVDRSGRRGRTKKSTFYFVVVEGGLVASKQRMTEEEFKARYGE